MTISSDSYVAAGAKLRVDCRAGADSTVCDGLTMDGEASSALREDGIERTLVRDGTDIVVGEIGPGEQQTVSLRFAGGGEDGFRLNLAASAWNATSATTSVAVNAGSGGSPAPGPTPRPPNDDFANAAALAAGGGQTTFDLVAATPEPGEPAYALAFGHPSRERSLWYRWTAPVSGLARFAVASAVDGDYADYIVVEAFRDGPITGLEPMGLAQIGGGNTFFAYQGETYRIRLSVHSANLAADPGEEGQLPMPTLTLSWGPASRPENDDYGLAAAIEGDAGTFPGSNQGATTEPGELIGNSNPATPADNSGWSGSVWYRWTAPASGDYRFSTNRRSALVAAFVGDTVGGARMVSGTPQAPPGAIVFPAAEGVEYRIGVATGSAYWSGADFELAWEPGEREAPGNDDMADAEFTFGDFAFGEVAFDDMTVEHGEPVESGVRTAWWQWTPSDDGRHTWLAQRLAGFVNDEAPLQMSVFERDDDGALQPVAVDTGDETLELQVAFDASGGSTYLVALGLPRDAAQARLAPATIIMEWGPTPENDDFADRTALVGMAGAVSGSNEFATNEKGEKTGSIGDSSLWWSFVPETTGWTRFELDGARGSKLAIYKIGADGSLELVMVSRALGTPAATFLAEAGTEYVVRLGTYYFDADGFGSGDRGEFTLSWAPADAPAMLRYVAAVASGDVSQDGMEIQFSGLGDQALNGDGTELYLATPEGILVFGRDAASGELTVLQTLAEHPVYDPSTQLIWDDAGSALLVASCEEWLRFTPKAGGGIEHAGAVDGAPCPQARVLLGGDLVHNVMPPWMIETYRFNETRDALDSVDLIMIPDVASAIMAADGANVYAITGEEDHELIAMERDADTGRLRISQIIADGSETGGGGVAGLSNVGALALHASHLFLHTVGGDTLVFDLADRANPAFLGNLESFIGSFNSCAVASARSDTAAVDVGCSGGYGRLFTVQVGLDGRLLPTDLITTSGFGSDAFGNVPPPIDDIVSLAGSPDGRHLYVAGSAFIFGFDPLVGFYFEDRYSLATFERVPQSDPTETEG